MSQKLGLDQLTKRLALFEWRLYGRTRRILERDFPPRLKNSAVFQSLVSTCRHRRMENIDPELLLPRTQSPPDGSFEKMLMANGLDRRMRQALVNSQAEADAISAVLTPERCRRYRQRQERMLTRVTPEPKRQFVKARRRGSSAAASLPWDIGLRQ